MRDEEEKKRERTGNRLLKGGYRKGEERRRARKEVNTVSNMSQRGRSLFSGRIEGRGLRKKKSAFLRT